MSSIANLFSNFDDLTKPKSVTNSATNYNNNPRLLSESLNQGRNFKKYQNKIYNSLEKKSNRLSGIEGFQNKNNTNTNNTNTNNTNTEEPEETTSTSITQQTTSLLKSTDISSQKQTIKELQFQYDAALKIYNALLEKISKNTNNYIDRVNPNNPYLNKTIHFTTGHIAYVTNKGVVKYIPSQEIWDSVKAPKEFVSVNIPWKDSWNNNPGITIPTNPPLVTGTFMIKGQSLGNEGTNVYVNSLVDTSEATYKGCYADTPSDPTMTFIGGSPPPENLIQNGNFSDSQIANDSAMRLTWDISTVPGGWNFNCVLINNSTAWGYPMPYPNGNQCASLQQTNELWTNWLHLTPGVTYTLSFYACGRNCCDNSNKGNPIDIGLEGKTFYSIDPPVDIWTKYTKTFTSDTDAQQRISFKGTWTSSDRSTAIQGVEVTSSNAETTGTYTYETCKNEAINGGYRFFGLQNVNTETSMGYCVVGNDSVSATKNGAAYVTSKLNPIWSTSTNGSGSFASVTDKGTLTVYNSTNAAIFNTPIDTKSTSNGYVGCYGDTGDRAMPNTSNNVYYSFDTCKQYAKDGGYKYYGSQDKQGNDNGWCVASNDLTKAQKYGVANNCTQDKSGNYMGGAWSNAIYSMDAKGTYYLILQDDGNMCIYKGKDPNDNQGLIWASNTNGKQQKANTSYQASSGKYGKNWIATGDTLAQGDFVGSTDGNIFLFMQTDGNLVLYTSETSEGCNTMKDGNTGGGQSVNALYEFTKVGLPANLGKVAYIDGNATSYIYPDSDIGLTNDYTSYINYDSPYNDIEGARFSGATVDSCKTACDNLTDCHGFAFNKKDKICWPKNKQVFPKSPRVILDTTDLYVRTPKVIKPPRGASDKLFNTDSLSYEHYEKSDKDMNNPFDLKNATDTQKQQLDHLKSTMDMLSSQIIDLTNKFDSGSQHLETKSKSNAKNLNTYVNDIEKINETIRVSGTTAENILRESDVVVLQQNYNYLFWSIMASATVLVAMNVVKKT